MHAMTAESSAACAAEELAVLFADRESAETAYVVKIGLNPSEATGAAIMTFIVTQRTLPGSGSERTGSESAS